ncbi:MAG: globin [Candidatus Melainabacteria bacterium]|nr:globin [Candidatus Melainabacteria bacterium]
MDPLSQIYKLIGSEEPYFRLVDEFYAGVEESFVLRPLYPEKLDNAKRSLALFLIQRTGGRTTYSDEKGHPRMRARHMPFAIGQAERDAWIVCMNRALDNTPEFVPVRKDLDAFFDHFATFMINKAN